MKSHETFVMALYEGIMSDALTRWPDIGSSMGKDLSYLRRAFKYRGLAFFTLTLPAYGSWIDRSLDHAAFCELSEVPRGIPKTRGEPCLFRGFLSKVFDNDGMLRFDADHEAVLFLRTLCQSLKKLEVPVTPQALKKTVKEFFDVEARLPKSWPDTWDSDVPTWLPRRGHPLWGELCPEVTSRSPDLFGDLLSSGLLLPWDTLRELSRRITSEVGVPNWDEIRPKHGPGAVSERRWESKYQFPHWPKKLAAWFPFEWHGSGDLSSDTFPSEREPFSRLIAVPKTAKGPRLICSEPIAHQWIQQGIWRWLETRIEATTLGRSISLRDQTKSQSVALAASRDGSKATLDLSAASDRLSCRLVEYIFQGSEILDGMHACRTRAVEQTIDRDSSRVAVLRKFSTMGSALTFPIQSIVFTILCVWAYRLYHGREDDWSSWREDFNQVRVFGDDLIVPIEAYSLTKFVLHECGLLVNVSKSFGGSHFRESCGMDAFDGVDVTPARYRKAYSGTASSTAALVEYSNNLHMKGLWRTAARILTFIPDKIVNGLVVGGGEESGLGLFSYCGSDLHLRRKRWDKALQREYVTRIGFSSRPKVIKSPGEHNLTQFFTEDPAGRRDNFLSPFPWQLGRVMPSLLTMCKLRVYT